MMPPRAFNDGREWLLTVQVLVIDDDAGVRKSVLRMLTAHGHHARSAGSGKEALMLALSLAPDVIVMDIHMPGQSGVEVAQALRDHPDLIQIPIIALSATAEDVDAPGVFHAILPKPCSSAALLDAVLSAAQARS